MNILIAPDKFKHSLSSLDACEAIKTGLLQASENFHIKILPLADGGDGLSVTIKQYISAKEYSVMVSNPLFHQISSSFLLSQDGKTAFIEMAKASGLQLLQVHEYNCMKTTSLGTGELIKAAIGLNVKKIIIGIGGSATNDCGIGMAAALGYRFLDKNNATLKPTGENLAAIEKIDSSNAIDLNHIEFKVACDVKNPLTGVSGATKVFAKQKGASAENIEFMEAGIIHFSEILKRKFRKDLSVTEGSGAAGGMGAGAIAFLNAELISGIDMVLKISQAEKHIREADIVLSGEGKIDTQSLNGKVISGVGRLCKKYNKPLLAFCGLSELSPEELNSIPVKAVYPIRKTGLTLKESYKKASELLSEAAYFAGKELLESI